MRKTAVKENVGRSTRSFRLSWAAAPWICISRTAWFPAFTTNTYERMPKIRRKTAPTA